MAVLGPRFCARALSSCGKWGHSSSRCAGLSLSRLLLLRSTGSRRAGSAIVAHGPSCSAPRHVGSSQTRARTCVPCISRQILNHCTTREAPVLFSDSLVGIVGVEGSSRWPRPVLVLPLMPCSPRGKSLHLPGDQCPPELRGCCSQSAVVRALKGIRCGRGGSCSGLERPYSVGIARWFSQRGGNQTVAPRIWAKEVVELGQQLCLWRGKGIGRKRKNLRTWADKKTFDTTRPDIFQCRILCILHLYLP